ncbi:MAG: hypothetical protein LBC02_05025 [Planctomycetaceae bacterium]|jgi:hypothetical protein|nr:hypothetical protein [Planctomycetaceae bacterium]
MSQFWITLILQVLLISVIFYYVIGAILRDRRENALIQLQLKLLNLRCKLLLLQKNQEFDNEKNHVIQLLDNFLQTAMLFPSISSCGLFIDGQNDEIELLSTNNFDHLDPLEQIIYETEKSLIHFYLFHIFLSNIFMFLFLANYTIIQKTIHNVKIFPLSDFIEKSAKDIILLFARKAKTNSSHFNTVKISL